MLTLRPLHEQDFEALYAAARDPMIWQQHPAADRWQEPVFRQYFRSAIDSGGAVLATRRSDGAAIGCSRFHQYKPERNEVEIGYTFLVRACWGGAFNGEMKRLMLEHAFQRVERVIFHVAPANLRSQRAMEKIGGVRAGTGPDSSGRESIIFCITRPSPSR